MVTLNNFYPGEEFSENEKVKVQPDREFKPEGQDEFQSVREFQARGGSLARREISAYDEFQPGTDSQPEEVSKPGKKDYQGRNFNQIN